jgi:hypothetical protein
VAITPTRTRTQTTLTKLVKMLAALNGEHAFCTGLLDGGELDSIDLCRLQSHVARLQAKREALRLTLLQFDPKLEVDSIGSLDTWRRRFGTLNLSEKTLCKRVVQDLALR